MRKCGFSYSTDQSGCTDGSLSQGPTGKTMETKNKVKVIKNKAKVKVNKSTVVEHPYCLRDRSVDDHTYPAHT